jgi:hypothetical protein
MFVIPFALATATAGVEWLVRAPFARRSPAMGTIAAAAAQAALAVVAAFAVTRSDVVRRAEDTGTLRDGAAIAALLADSARPRDRVIASAPTDLPLAYHLRARIGNDELLRATPDSAPRLWVVVNDVAGQTEARLVNAAEIVTDDYGPPRLVRRLPEASVFVRQRERPGCALDPTVCR